MEGRRLAREEAREAVCAFVARIEDSMMAVTTAHSDQCDAFDPRPRVRMVYC